MQTTILPKIPKIASMRQVQRNYRALFDWVKETQEPLVLTNGSTPYVIVLSPVVYQNYFQKQESEFKQEVNLNPINKPCRLTHSEWKTLKADLRKISKSGKRRVNLTQFVINDRTRH